MQVYSISPVSVQRVLSSMLESISNAVYHRLNEVGEFTENSAVNVGILTTSFFDSLHFSIGFVGSYRVVCIRVSLTTLPNQRIIVSILFCSNEGVAIHIFAVEILN